MSAQDRQPAGVPAGGQFAEGVRGENGTTLRDPQEVADEAVAMGSMYGASDLAAAALKSAPSTIDLTGTAAQVREQALESHWRSRTILQLAGAKQVAEAVLAAHPDACTLTLGASDQEGGGFFGGEVLDVNGNELADWEQFSDEADGALSDLPNDVPLKVVLDGGKTRYEDDARYSFLTVHDDGSASMDLKAAATIDLTVL